MFLWFWHCISPRLNLSFPPFHLYDDYYYYYYYCYYSNREMDVPSQAFLEFILVSARWSIGSMNKFVFFPIFRRLVVLVTVSPHYNNSNNYFWTTAPTHQQGVTATLPTQQVLTVPPPINKGLTAAQQIHQIPLLVLLREVPTRRRSHLLTQPWRVDPMAWQLCFMVLLFCLSQHILRLICGNARGVRTII